MCWNCSPPPSGPDSPWIPHPQIKSACGERRSESLPGRGPHSKHLGRFLPNFPEEKAWDLKWSPWFETLSPACFRSDLKSHFAISENSSLRLKQWLEFRAVSRNGVWPSQVACGVRKEEGNGAESFMEYLLCAENGSGGP